MRISEVKMCLMPTYMKHYDVEAMESTYKARNGAECKRPPIRASGYSTLLTQAP
jgi:hypothetical protein